MNQRGYLLVSLACMLPVDFATAQVQPLSEVALFQRCYRQITNTRVTRSNPLFIQVATGQKSAADACVAALDKAQLTANANQTIANQNDAEAKAVLSTLHHLHSSWFTSKDFPVINQDAFTRDVANIYDSSTPGMFFTRALFKPSTPVKTVVTETLNLRAYRTNQDPPSGAEAEYSKTDYIFTPLLAFAPQGELIGIQAAAPLIVSYPAKAKPKPGYPAGSLDLNATLGGGLLGTNAYLLLNTPAMATDEPFQADGAVKMYRRWGKAVYSDLFCREMPVVREADVVSFVDRASTVPFRTSSSCTKCHASQDRTAAVIRGYEVTGLGQGTLSNPGAALRGGQFPTFHAVAKPPETSWPTTADSDYYQRPTNGVMYLRSYTGDLIERPVMSVADLGQKISETDDFYVCVAKRYYYYFTGINVNNGDLGDPYRTEVLSAGDLAHRNTVIALGKSLVAHQSLRQLISDILHNADYRKTDFGISGD